MRRSLAFIYLIFLSMLFGQDWSLTETARSAGMGNAFTAIGEGADAMVLNPAGLFISPRHQVQFTYTKNFSGLDFGSIYQATLLYTPRNEGRFNWGFGLNLFSEDIYQQMSASLAYGGRVLRFGRREGYLSVFAIGNMFRSSYKTGEFIYIPEDDENPIDPLFANGESKMAFGADVSFMLKYKSLRIGGRVSNLNEPNTALDDTVEAGKLPRKMRVGVAYTLWQSVTPSVDIAMPMSSDVGIQDAANYHAGVEGWLFRGLMGLRAGVNINDVNDKMEMTSYTGGFSLRKLGGFGAGLDYALIYPKPREGIGLPVTHKISLDLGTEIPAARIIDLEVVKDSMSVNPSILTAESTGQIRSIIENTEKDNSRAFNVAAYWADSTGERHLIERQKVKKLKGKGGTKELDFQWTPPKNGFYEITVEATPNKEDEIFGLIEETNEQNNSASFVIPSFYAPEVGTIALGQTNLDVSLVTYVKEEIPVNPMVFFDEGKSDIANRFELLLANFVKRLSMNPDVVLQIRGYYDKFTEKDMNATELAISRARAARQKLIELGAPADRVVVVESGYDPASTEVGMSGERPGKLSLDLIAQENRRVEFSTQLKTDTNLLAIAIDPNSANLSSSDMSKVETAVTQIKDLLSKNPDIEVMVLGKSKTETRNIFNTISDVENKLEMTLGYLFAGRIFGAFDAVKDDSHTLELHLSAEPMVYRPLTMSNVSEGIKIATESENKIKMEGFSSDAPIDSFYIVVNDNEGGLFRVLAAGNEKIPDEVSWDWRGVNGEPPDPNKTYHLEYYLKDAVGQEVSKTSDEIDISAQRIEHKEELILINFNFGGTTPNSNYIESRVENVAKEILAYADQPLKSMTVTIGGHTDIIGDEKFNLKLSKERAEREYRKLRSYLIKYLKLSDDAALDEWLKSKRITLDYAGYGPSTPFRATIWDKGYYKDILIGLNEYPEGRIMNRRVSAKIKVEM